MVVEFTVGNYRSFKDKVTLSLEAGTVSEYPENTFKVKKLKLLKSAVVYGANASGKSNLLQAISTMREVLLNNFRKQSTNTLPAEPFLLEDSCAQLPCFFQLNFIIEEVLYRYGFEITAEKVRSEWLYRKKANIEKPLFLREEDVIELFPGFEEGKDLEERTLDNGFFLAVCDAFNGAISKKIMHWFNNLSIISGVHHDGYRTQTLEMLENPTTHDDLKALISLLDLGFEDLELSKDAPEEPRMIQSISMVAEKSVQYMTRSRRKIKTIHKVFDQKGLQMREQKFDLDQMESSGTQKIFDIIGPIFWVLKKGGIAVIDELDAKLHPLLTRAFIRIFNSEENNPHNAQLVFASHDINLLSYGHFRRDQIYFVEKDHFGASNLYSLIEFKEVGQGKIRKDRSFEKDYIQGRYGSIPFLGDFSKLIQQWQGEEKLTAN